MTAEFENCPCTGKSMTSLVAPWILLTLHREGATHGYDLARTIKAHHEALGIGLNPTGLYRHLAALEERGMLRSQWDQPERGLPKRLYSLTEEGEGCLRNWIDTLTTHARLIEGFFDEASRSLPDQPVPSLSLSRDRRGASETP